MTPMNDIIVEAIYQDGLIKPLETINLPDNVRVKVQITPHKHQSQGGLSKYKGVLAGHGDFSFEEIQDIVHSATESRLRKLLDTLNQEVE
jgi:predicted DNA-binding antitoxin AbrB/MazE fold protein